MKTTGHNIKWDHFDILASGKTDLHCKIKENLFIQELKPSPMSMSIVKSCCFTRGGGGVLPYMGYIGMCGPKGYGFSAVLVINRVSILADFGHFGHK